MDQPGEMKRFRHAARAIILDGQDYSSGPDLFSPRDLASLESTVEHADALTRLGAHATGVGCLYIKDLKEVDLEVLRGILVNSLRWAENGGGEDVVLTVTG